MADNWAIDVEWNAINSSKPSDNSWVEPPSMWNPKPEFNKVTQTESGHAFEMDDTPNYERVRLQHRTGTFTEMHPDGSRVDKIVGDNYVIVAKNNNVRISGSCNITIDSNCALEVNGDTHINTKGDTFVNSKGETYVNSDKDMRIYSGANMDVFAPEGRVNIRSNDVQIDGDVTISGDLSCSGSVNVDQNLSCGQKVFAIQGIDTIAGINAGTTTPGPNPPGVISSTVSVLSPLVFGAVVVKDSFGSLGFLRLAYNTHFHVNDGYSPPIFPAFLL